MLKRGEVDIAYSIRGPLAEELRRTPGLTLMPTYPSGTFWLVFPEQWTDPKSPWADRRVRLAANLRHRPAGHQPGRDARASRRSPAASSRTTFDWLLAAAAPAVRPDARQAAPDRGRATRTASTPATTTATRRTPTSARPWSTTSARRASGRSCARWSGRRSSPQNRDKKLKNIIQTASGAVGNAATRLDAFVAAGGTFTYGDLSRHRRAHPRAGRRASIRSAARPRCTASSS